MTDYSDEKKENKKENEKTYYQATGEKNTKKIVEYYKNLSEEKKIKKKLL